ncbi:diphthamide synthesis protein [Candidatus Woesearchaeota archaeon]|nr:diphthamide synthesis protein [Candidatus Woesearchaeota archaeon]
MEFYFVESYYKGDILLSEEALIDLKNKKAIALFAAVQFIKLDNLKAQLEEQGHEVLITHGKRTSGKYQLLGCDCYSDAFADADIFKKADIVLYIGDGLFHPKALLLAQQECDVMVYDPKTNTHNLLTQDDIDKQKKRYKANIIKYLSSDIIGIMATTKTGQNYLKNAIKLKENLKAKGKQAYVFCGDTLNYSEMENFPFIECWVNTACPRIGFDDVVHMPRPLININDAFKLLGA